MKKSFTRGFAYLAVLFLLTAVLSAAGFFTFAALRWREMIRQDMHSLQARQMAQNAVVYLEYALSAPSLTAHDLRKLTGDDLLNLAGFDFIFADQGFRIIHNQDVFYFVGYAGQLPVPAAVFILYKRGDKIQPWYE